MRNSLRNGLVASLVSIVGITGCEKKENLPTVEGIVVGEARRDNGYSFTIEDKNSQYHTFSTYSGTDFAAFDSLIDKGDYVLVDPNGSDLFRPSSLSVVTMVKKAEPSN